MKTYLIIFAVIFTIALIAGVVNSIAKKNNPYGITAELSNLLANGLGIISIFMFIGGLLTIFC